MFDEEEITTRGHESSSSSSNEESTQFEEWDSHPEENQSQSPRPRNDLLISNLRNELEFQNIVAAMAVTPNRSKAAEKLGISPRTLRYKINKLRDLGMPVPAAYARV